ncbi:MAG: hypothetical protein ABI352_03940 [Candidatus Dormibacter sp.]
MRIYSFLSQVVTVASAELERDYIYCRALANYLRDATTSERLDLGTEVELTHLRNEVTFEGSLALQSDTGEVRSIFGDAAGKQQELQLVPLSEIVLELNERFGLYLTERDQLLFDQFEEEWAADPDLTAQAQNNTLDNFRLVFDKIFLGTIVKRMDANDAIFKQILDDPDFKAHDRRLLRAQGIRAPEQRTDARGRFEVSAFRAARVRDPEPSLVFPPAPPDAEARESRML